MSTTADNLHHQSDPHNPKERPQPQHTRPYKLPWYKDTVWSILANKLTKGKALPFPEEREDFVPPGQYLPGY